MNNPEQLSPLSDEEIQQEEKKMEQNKIRNLIEESDLLSDEEKADLKNLSEQDPNSINLEEKSADLNIPKELLEKFQEDRQAIVNEFLKGTEDHVSAWFESNLPDIQNKEKTIAACIALEQRIIQNKGKEFVEGQIDTLDLSHISVLITVAQYENANGEQASSAIKLEVQGYEQTASNGDLTSKQEEEEIDSAKEVGEYREESK